MINWEHVVTLNIWIFCLFQLYTVKFMNLILPALTVMIITNKMHNIRRRAKQTGYALWILLRLALAVALKQMLLLFKLEMEFTDAMVSKILLQC